MSAAADGGTRRCEGTERGGGGGDDHPVEELTPEAMVRMARHGEDGRRRYRARTAAARGEVVELDLATGSVPARFA